MAQATDSFQRGAGETAPYYLENHTADTGGTWVNLSTPGDKVVLLGNGKIRSTVNSPSSASWHAMTGANTPATADYAVTVRLNQLTSVSGNAGIGLRADPTTPFTGSAGSCYVAYYSFNSGTLVIGRIIGGGASTTLASVALAFPVSSSKLLTAKIQTDTSANNVLIQLFLDGSSSPALTFADASASGILDIGKPAIYSYNGGNVDDATGVQFSEFSTQDLNGSGGSTGVTLNADDANWLRSPLNWLTLGSGAAAAAVAVNAGASFKTLAKNLSSLTLRFGVAQSAALDIRTRPMIYVCVDKGVMQYFPVAATITPALPASRSPYRLIEAGFCSLGATNRWTPASGQDYPAGAVVFLGADCNAGAAFEKPPVPPLTVAVFGDSKGEGIDLISATGPYFTSDSNAPLGWIRNLEVGCNAAVANLCFGGQALTTTANAPLLPTGGVTFNKHYAGKTRSLAGIDLAVFQWDANEDASQQQLFASELVKIGQAIRAESPNVKFLILRGTDNRMVPGVNSAAASIAATVEAGLVGNVILADDTTDNVHPSVATTELLYTPVVSAAINKLQYATATGVPTGNLPAGNTLLRFSALATATDISTYPALQIVWHLPDGGSWESGKPGGPAFQAVKQFVPGQKYFVLASSPVSILGAEL